MKIDFRKEYKNLYGASTSDVAVVDVPSLNFLMVDGKGDPNTSAEYQAALEALYAMSYWVKFAVKKGKDGIDFAVMPLEGLWWTEDMTQFTPERKDIWQWTAMIMQPEYVSDGLYREALIEVAKKNLASLSKVRLAAFDEGLCAQVMYIGPYSAEGPTIARLHDVIRGQRHELRGKHHEIYLGDPRRSAPEKLKTIIRQPIE